MTDFEYRIAALCLDGEVSKGANSSRDLEAVKGFRDQLAASGEFSDVWVERGERVWERVS